MGAGHVANRQARLTTASRPKPKTWHKDRAPCPVGVKNPRISHADDARGGDYSRASF